ncbi:hypothetical protein B0H13DRAFT_2269654 [Mycena leptocephala]|nr:hypothetical protein B0H13DRAFT_2269654 [Mycena leptocephala]
MIHVGTAGPANLVNHKPACKGRPKGKIQKISDMFISVPKPRAPQALVPSTVTVAVSSVPPVPLVPSTSTAAPEYKNENDASFSASALRPSFPGADLTLVAPRE